MYLGIYISLYVTTIKEKEVVNLTRGGGGGVWKVLEGGKGRGKWCNYNIKKSYKNLKEKWLWMVNINMAVN